MDAIHCFLFFADPIVSGGGSFDGGLARIPITRKIEL